TNPRFRRPCRWGERLAALEGRSREHRAVSAGDGPIAFGLSPRSRSSYSLPWLNVISREARAAKAATRYETLVMAAAREANSANGSLPQDLTRRADHGLKAVLERWPVPWILAGIGIASGDPAGAREVDRSARGIDANPAEALKLSF